MADSGLLAAILGPTYGLLTPNYGVQKPYMFGGTPGGAVRPVQSPIMSPLGVAMLPSSEGGETGVPGAAASSNVSTAGPTTPNQVPDMGPVGRQNLAQAMANPYSGPNMFLGIMGQMGGPLFDLAVRGLKMAMVAHNKTVLAEQLDKEFKAGRAIGFDPDPTGFNPAREFGLQQMIGPLTPEELALARAVAQRADEPLPDEPPGLQPDAPTPADPSDPGGVPGDTSAQGDTSTSGAGVADFDKGGLVPRRMKARLAGGEYIIQAPAVPRNIKLLKKINQGTPVEVRRMARRVAQ